MKNVTISVDDDTALWARVEAAKRNTSVSRFVGELLREQMTARDAYGRAARSYRRRPPTPLKSAGHGYPSRHELHDR